MKTYNFRTQEYTYSYPPIYKDEFRDGRNGIICVNPSVNIECYINYIDLLNGLTSQWKSAGYLDLGMMPFVMLPSFMPQQMKPALVALASNIGLPCYDMPPVSVMFAACKMPEEDIWVLKSDVAKIMGVPESQVTLGRFLRRINNELNRSEQNSSR